jgi:hypothetical protein
VIRQMLKTVVIYLLICIFGGIAYSQIATRGVPLTNFFTGSIIIGELVSLYFIFTTVSLFVFSSIVLRGDTLKWNSRLVKIMYITILSFSPLIIFFIGLVLTKLFYVRSFLISDFLRYIIFILKGITPIMLFISFWKVYRIDFYKSCLIVSSYYIIYIVLSYIPTMI